MDRRILYPAQIPLVEDQLYAQRYTQIGIGRLSGSLYGERGTGASGFTCEPGTGLSVTVAPGQIVQPGIVDATAYGVVDASSSALPRQYILTDPVTLAIPAAGDSYVVYGTPSTSDGNSVVLPFFNSSDTSQTFAGADNSGAALPVTRIDGVSIGIGTTVPTGAVPLWSIVVPSGANSVTASMISAASGAPFYPSLPDISPWAGMPFNAALAAAFGGYPLNAIVADATTAGKYWRSTTDGNLTMLGASGAAWVDFFADITTILTGITTPVLVTSSSSVVAPSWATRVEVIAVGAGAGGSDCQATGSSVADTNANGGGGGAGAYARVILPITDGQTLGLNIGAAGGPEGNGGATTVYVAGTLALTCNGGAKSGFTQTGNSPGGYGGTVSLSLTTGTLLENSAGSAGGDGQNGSFIKSGMGGNGPWGGGGRDGQGAGESATGFGAGGGGAYDSAFSNTLYAGGSGFQGCCIYRFLP